MRVREASVGLVDRHLRAVEVKHGAASAKQTKTVLGQILAHAARHDAIVTNPVRETSSISTKPKKPARSFTEAQALQLLAFLTYDAQAVMRDIPAFVAMMLATGMRIGEMCGVLWRSVDLDTGTVTVEATVVRLRGKGLYRKPEPKTAASYRMLTLPGWCSTMLRARTRGSGVQGGGGGLPIPKGEVAGPVEHSGRSARRIQAIFDEATVPQLQLTQPTIHADVHARIRETDADGLRTTPAYEAAF